MLTIPNSKNAFGDRGPAGSFHDGLARLGVWWAHTQSCYMEQVIPRMQVPPPVPHWLSAEPEVT